uniref:BTB domain-containing protein n=1 Tax=Plectus sambesii TaxID=2011161 RepID=A0A914WBY6_9BILA
MRPSGSKQYTKVEVEQIEFEWIVNDYSRKTLLESDFFNGNTGDTIWSMRMKKTRGWLSVTVQRVDSKLRQISGSISLSLRNHQTGELSHVQAVQIYPSDVGFAGNANWDDLEDSALFKYDFPHIIREHLLCTDAQLLQNDQLIIVCEIFAKAQPILEAQQGAKSLSQFASQESHHTSIEADRNEKDVLDRSYLSPDSGIYDAKDRKKKVSFDLSQFANDLTSQYNKLMGNAQDTQENYEHRYSDDEYLVDAVNDDYGENDSNDDVFISEDVSHETSILEKLSTESEAGLSPRRSIVIEAYDEFVHCKLISSDGEVDAYKSVSPLGADREIFSAMLTKRSYADSGRRPKVDEVEQAVMIELSRFALSGKVLNLDQLAEGLFAAAHKYGIDDLKELCHISMCKGINDDNVCTRLILADEHPLALGSLKMATIDYFKQNLERVDKFNGYNSLLAEHPRLVAEIFFSLSKIH